MLDLRSPSEQTSGLVYFGRMLDKIRLHERGELPTEYHANLGEGFDQFCTEFLRVSYPELVIQTKAGGSDEELLAWCFGRGQQRDEKEIFIWNEFMRKRGWNDDITATLQRRKEEAGLAGRSDIQTMFAFIDADEGRPARE